MPLVHTAMSSCYGWTAISRPPWSAPSLQALRARYQRGASTWQRASPRPTPAGRQGVGMPSRFVAPNERKVRIEVGYGFEGTLTDAISKLIIENSTVPRFRANDFAGGIGAAVSMTSSRQCRSIPKSGRHACVQKRHSEQSRAGVTDECVGVAAVGLEHLERLVPGDIRDLDQVRASLHPHSSRSRRAENGRQTGTDRS